MGRKRKGRRVNGILLVDKPTGVSSNHVVQHIKRLYGAQKAGHTGALDPLATGLLPVCLGEATKFSQCLLDANKGYLVTAKLGERTDTSDADGKVVEKRPVEVTEQQIREVAASFVGDIQQIPTMYSALKYEGKPLYWYARKGIEIERPARSIKIIDITWHGLEDVFFTMAVKCSKGTYIRTLIDDIGEQLGCGAHVTKLRRTEVGHFKGHQMFTYDYLEKHRTPPLYNLEEGNSGLLAHHFSDLDQLLLCMDVMLEGLASLIVSDTAANLFQQGGHLDIKHNSKLGEQVRVYRESDNLFLGLAFISESNYVQPKRVVVY